MRRKAFTPASISETIKESLLEEPQGAPNAGEEAEPVQTTQETPEPAPAPAKRRGRKPGKLSIDVEYEPGDLSSAEVPRVNIALSRENYEFLKQCSGIVYGSRNMTHLINILIDKYRKEKEDVLRRAIALREELES
jgi:hypothetical protein